MEERGERSRRGEEDRAAHWRRERGRTLLELEGPAARGRPVAGLQRRGGEEMQEREKIERGRGARGKVRA